MTHTNPEIDPELLKGTSLWLQGTDPMTNEDMLLEFGYRYKDGEYEFLWGDTVMHSEKHNFLNYPHSFNEQFFNAVISPILADFSNKMVVTTTAEQQNAVDA